MAVSSGVTGLLVSGAMSFRFGLYMKYPNRQSIRSQVKELHWKVLGDEGLAAASPVWRWWLKVEAYAEDFFAVSGGHICVDGNSEVVRLMVKGSRKSPSWISIGFKCSGVPMYQHTPTAL